MDETKSTVLTEKDFNEFLSATGDARWKILLAHAERNKKIIQIRRTKKMNEQYNDHHYEEIGKQFEEFCRTKGITAKFKVAFSNMAESARKQKEADKAHLEEVKRQSAEANPEFAELLHTKGFKAKVQLIIAGLKKSVKENNERVRKQIAEAKHGAPSAAPTYTADELAREFNAFLKAKGLDDKYVVEVKEEDKE